MAQIGVNAGAAQRFEALDGWRGLCALMVVLLHAPVTSSVTQSGLVRHSFLFVDFFFVLSGFVIAHASASRLAERRDIVGFLGSRLARVYPLHLFMLGLFVAFELLLLTARGPDGAFQGGSSVVALVHNVLMTHSLGVLDQLGWNYPSWSISAELVAYTAFALMVLLARRALPLVLLAVALVAASIVAVRVGHLDTTVGYGWLRCLFGFSIGALLRLFIWPRTAAEPRARDRAFWTLAEVATVALVIVFVARAGLTPLALAAPLVFAYAIYVFAHEGGVVSSLLKSRPIAFLGLISYSIYMTHAFVISRLVNVASVAEGTLGRAIFSTDATGAQVIALGEGAGALALALILCATIVFSAITWRLVERPGQRFTLGLFKRFGSRRAEVTGKATQPV